MKLSVSGKIRPALLALLVLVLAGPHAAADENRHDSASSRPAAIKVRLQIRISEAKKKKEAIRYYRSVARQQKSGKIRPSGSPSR